MLYRLYKPEEFEALYAIEVECFTPPLRFERAYLEKLTRARSSATWVAVSDEGNPAGFAVVEWKRRRYDVVVAYLVTLEVVQEQRRQGVGGALLGKAEESAQAAGAEAIWLHVEARNEAALSLYRRHGYMEGGSAEDFYGPGRGARILVKLLGHRNCAEEE